LRHNLLANMAFLLEILRLYPAAIDFWERAFRQYIDAKSSPLFDITFHYRLGMLHSKNGNLDTALAFLSRALEFSRVLGEVFMEERIAYALGFVALQAEDWDLADRSFASGFEVAWQERDWQACYQHADGAFEVSARSRNGHMTSQRIRQYLKKISSPPLKAGADSGQLRVLRPPSPKLPAYLPNIDLDWTPEVDLNRQLVAEPAQSAT
jgi:tetratricopeptide (TPR) repeat protein